MRNYVNIHNWPVEFVLIFIDLMVVFHLYTSENIEENRITCFDGTVESWVGNTSGNANFCNALIGSTANNLVVNILDQETGKNYLTVNRNVPNYYLSKVSRKLISPSDINFVASEQCPSANMYKRDGQLKLIGNAKQFVYRTNSLVMKKIVELGSLIS